MDAESIVTPMMRCLRSRFTNLYRLRGGIFAGDAPLDSASGQTMETESTSRLATTVKARYHIAREVHRLALRVNSETGARVVDDGRRPPGIEGWRLDLILRSWLAKIRVFAGVHVRIISGHRFF